jgi:hypothetical protein
MGCTISRKDEVAGARRPVASSKDCDAAVHQQIKATVDEDRWLLVEGLLELCYKNSNVESRNLRQREEVEEIMASSRRPPLLPLAALGAHSFDELRIEQDFHRLEKCEMYELSGIVAARSTNTSSASLRSMGTRSLCTSGLPVANLGSLNSQLKFMDPDQTIILFDWDDTICPSTWVRSHVRFDKKGKPANSNAPSIQQELTKLVDQALPLLRAAKAMAQVVIVTNARRPWVETSCQHFMPSLMRELEGVNVIYAMEFLEEDEADYMINPELLTEAKARAMKSAVSDFYSRYRNQSWKNVVSIGDALYEHDAIRQVTHERPTDSKKCRTKTIKLMEGPTSAVMVKQLGLVESWLAKVVNADHDIDIDLSADLAALTQWVQEYSPDAHDLELCSDMFDNYDSIV